MRLLILCFSLLALVSARAQHHHFLYLQADQQQPFYVKMGTTVLSSSADGFLIIPRLRDSAVQMIIGFPSKKFPEYRFRFDGFRKDRGMALKDFGEKGWGLFDYQTLEIVMGERIEEPRAVVPPPPVPLTKDAFTVVLASVIDDPGLLATPLVQMGPKEVYVQASAPERNPPPARETAAQPTVAGKKPSSQVSIATVPVSTDSGVMAIVPEQPSAIKSVLKATPADPGIRKIADQERPSGRALLFLDLSPASPDTVDVFIPLAVEAAVPVQRPAEPLIPTPVVEVVATKQADSTTGLVEAKPKAPVAEERIITDATDTTAGKARVTSGAVQPALVQPDTAATKPGKPMRANCVRMASEKDLQALRKRMVGIRDEDDMVAAALKDVKQRCYTTEQVRALSFIFVRQEGKYKLIDAVYPHVYDPANYGDLEPLLTDKYFIHRFRALVQ